MATKADLVAHLTSTIDGVSKKDCAQAVDAVFEAVAEKLAAGERVRLPGFGTFKLTQRAARQGRNPQTGAVIQLPESTGVRFKASPVLRASLPGNPTTPPRKPKTRLRRTRSLAGKPTTGPRKKNR